MGEAAERLAGEAKEKAKRRRRKEKEEGGRKKEEEQELVGGLLRAGMAFLSFLSLVHFTLFFLCYIYIDRPSSCQFSSSRDRIYIDRSFIVSVLVGAAPISIDHLPISSVSGTAPISIGHHRVSLSRSRTYIDQPSSYQFSLSRDRTYIDRSLSCQFESRPHLYRSAISLS